MRVGGVIMTIIFDGMMWKVLTQVVESTLIVWEDLGLSPMYAICVLFNYYCFNNTLEHVCMT